MSDQDEKNVLNNVTEEISDASPLSEEGYSAINDGVTVADNGAEVLSGVEVAKRSPKKLIAVIAVVVAALLACCALSYALIPQVRNAARSLLTSNESYYAWVENTNLKNETDKLTETLDKIKDFKGGSNKLTIKPDSNGISKFIESQNNSVNVQGLKLPSDITLESKSKADNGDLSATASVFANGSSLFTVNTYANEKGLFYKFPELSDSYIGLNFKELLEKASETATNENAKKMLNTIKGMLDNVKSEGELISSDDLKGIIKKYGGIIFDNVQKVDKETDVEVEIQGIKSKYTKLTANIDEGTLFSIAKKAVSEIKTDSVIKDIIVNKLGVSEDDYNKLIDELSEKLNKYEDVKGGDTLFALETYVNSKGEVAGRALKNPKDDSFALGYTITNDNDNYGFELFMKGSDTSERKTDIIVSGTAEKADDKWTGKASLSSGDKTDVLTLSFSDLECNDDGIEGSITAGLSAIGFDDITVNFKEEDGKQLINSDITYSGSKLLTVEYEADKNVPDDIPEFNESATVYSIENIKDYTNSVDKTKIQELGKKIMEALGIDLNTLESGLANSAANITDSISGTGLMDGVVTNDGLIDLNDLESSTATTEENTGTENNADGDYVEVAYDLSKVKLQLDGKDINLPGKVEGIDKLVKFDSETLEKYLSAYGTSEDYSLAISVMNNSEDKLKVTDCDVTYINESNTKKPHLSVDGFKCGDDINKFAEKYGITLKNKDSANIALEDKNDEFNRINVFYVDGKIWTIDISMYDFD